MAVAVDQPYLQDKRVRQAMLYAIDRAGIVSQVLAGQASITNTHVMGPPEAIPSDLNKYEYNPDKARRCCRRPAGIRTRVIKIQWIQGIRDRDATVQIVQAQLQAVGMKVELNPLEAGPLVDNIRTARSTSACTVAGCTPSTATAPRCRTSASQAYPAGGNNAHYCNADVDAAFAAGRATSDAARSATRPIRRWRTSPMTRCRTSGCTCRRRCGRIRTSCRISKPHGELTYGFWNAAEWKLAPVIERRPEHGSHE